MKTDSRLYTFNDESARLNIMKMKIIANIPYEVLANVKHIHENIRDNMELSRIKTKQNMMAKKTQTMGGRTKHERLQPGENTLSKGTGKKEMLRCLNGLPTKTRNSII